MAFGLATLGSYMSPPPAIDLLSLFVSVTLNCVNALSIVHTLLQCASQRPAASLPAPKPPPLVLPCSVCWSNPQYSMQGSLVYESDSKFKSLLLQLRLPSACATFHIGMSMWSHMCLSGSAAWAWTPLSSSAPHWFSLALQPPCRSTTSSLLSGLQFCNLLHPQGSTLLPPLFLPPRTQILFSSLDLNTNPNRKTWFPNSHKLLTAATATKKRSPIFLYLNLLCYIPKVSYL